MGLAILSDQIFFGQDKPSFETPVAKSDLAARLNAACKPGYIIYDWTVGDEFHRVPPGIVEVTCVLYHENGDFDQYKTAVAR
jgi:hypothetical protein